MIKMLFPNIYKWIVDGLAKGKKMLIIFITILLVVVLVLTFFTITTKIQVNRLRQHFDTFLAEYQSLSNANPEPAVPVEKAPAEAGNYLNPYTQ